MLEKLVAFCALHRWMTLAVTALLCVLGWLSLRSLPIDAIPDLSDTQVIVYSRWDRPPDIVEDQVTYPVVEARLGRPQV
jgi:Cu(I)/Ag(I) efflux system membrane protein CusA/SilA